jgi:hypothetical protein
MYWGLPNEFFQEKEEKRKASFENSDLKILNLSNNRTYGFIKEQLIKSKARWNDFQKEAILSMDDMEDLSYLNFNDFNFKENAVVFFGSLYRKNKININFSSPIDVMRFISYLSNNEADLRNVNSFSSVSRKDRKFAIKALNTFGDDLMESISHNPNMWKKFFRRIHPGDYKKYNYVISSYSNLYNKYYQSFSSHIEQEIKNKNPLVLKDLCEKPGEFSRRLHKLYSVFDDEAFKYFVKVSDRLSTKQLLSLKKYFLNTENRQFSIFPPNGNWSKAQVTEFTKKPVNPSDLNFLVENIDSVIKKRLLNAFPEGFEVDEKVENVKFQTNDQKLADYGRGTTFDIPDNVKFIRTASFWKYKDSYNTRNIWFDNGWNFFKEDWSSCNGVAWNRERHKNNSAIFSGDPTNTKDLEGRGCQMIDLYPEKLISEGVRYAVWSILCYSNIPFDAADDVVATLQWGEEPQKNKLYEPSRAQMVFPIKDKGLTKFVAYIDLVERKLVYMDANLPARVYTAISNSRNLSKIMPAYEEYLKTLPSYYDLFKIVNKKGKIPILYSDENQAINGKAFVFKKNNESSNIEDLEIENILEDSTKVIAAYDDNSLKPK